MKNAKRSVIITAILAIIMCASLAAGATFALFTSSSSVNIAITSANVEVTADVAVTKTWHEDNNVEKAGLYDTGKAEVTYENNQAKLTLSNFVPTDGVKLAVSLKNESTVKIKYRVMLLADRTAGTELLDELNIDMNGMEFRGYTLATEYVELEAGASINDIPVTIVFPKEATEGKNTTCNLAIKVDAQQGNAVADNTFDVAEGHTIISETAEDGSVWYSEVDNKTLFAEINNGAKLAGDVTLTEDVDPAKTIIAADGSNVEINANGKTVANTDDIWSDDDWSLVSAQGGSTVTISGNGTFHAKENDCYAVDVQNGAKVVINDGTFIGNIHSVYVTDGIAEIKGGFFSVQQKYPDASKANEFVLNCLDANHANGTANIIVTGGTFVNFNPADCYAEGEHTNFVADGYHVEVAVQENGDVWYTVENGAVTTVSAVEGQNTAEVLSEVFKTAESGKSLYVALKDDVTIDTLRALNGTTNDGVKDIVIDANGHTIKTEKADGSRCVRVESSTVERTYTLMNAKIVCTATTASINAGEQRGQQIYEVENATINLVNCTVEMTANNFSYPVKVIGGKNLTVNIKGCTLTGANCIEVVDSSDCTFNIADCVLNSNYPDNTRYVGEGIQDKGSRNNTYNVKNCTFNGSNAAPWELGAGSVVNDLGGNVYNMTISEKA